MSATAIIPEVPSSDFADQLSAVPIFNGLSDAVMDAISANSDRRHYDSGHSVYSAGNFDASEFFVIIAGRARVSRIAPETGAIAIEDLDAGGIFGLELAWLEGKREAIHTISVTAEEDLKLIAFDGAEFRLLAAQRPSLMRNVAKFFAQELSDSREKVTIAEPAPHQRVFAALLAFVKRDTQTGQWHIAHMPKHRQLADQAGVDEAVTAEAVATLIQEGVAERDYPGMLIKDISRLNELAS